VPFMCAYANWLVSGFGVTDADVRQATPIAKLCSPEHVQRIRELAIRSGRRAPTVFFRGQMLELMRWTCRCCDPDPGDARAFDDPGFRSRFLAAALVAGQAWGRTPGGCGAR